MTGIEVDISGPVAAIDASVAALSDQKAGPLGDAWKKVGEASIDFAREKFDKNSPGGGDWPALAPSTIKAKGHDLILIDTKKLRGSLDKGGTNQVMRLTGEGVDAGTKDPKAKFHQEGGVNLPRRVVLPKLSSDVKKTGLTLLSDANLKILKSASDPATPKVP